MATTYRKELFVAASLPGCATSFTLYRLRVDEWAVYDNEAGGPVLIASGDRHGEHVLDSAMFDRLRARSSATSRSNDGKLKP